METYETEEQQVEALKKWWKENGRSVIAGIVIGLGAVGGWQAWNSYKGGVNEQAANAFAEITVAVDSGNTESAIKQAERLIEEYGSTSYATFAALTRAKLAMEAGDSVTAQSQLEWALDHAPDSGFEQIARIRLARVLFTKGDLDSAAALAQQGSKAFAGEYAALRGDIAAARGDKNAARAAYQEALDNGASDPALIQMKLDDLAPAESPAKS